MNKSHFPLFTFHLPDVEALRFGSMLTLFNNPYVKLINATLLGKKREKGERKSQKVKKSKSRKVEEWKSGSVEKSKSRRREEWKIESGKLKIT